eukprot:111548_1
MKSLRSILIKRTISPLQSQLNYTKYGFSTFNLNEVMSQPEKLLLTPGPLSTSSTVKACLTRDFGSRDQTFIDLINSVRQGVLDIAQVSNKDYTCVLMQGSGTFSVESAIGSIVPRDTGKILIITNGAYADRAGKIAKYLNIPMELLRYVEDTKPSPLEVEQILSEHSAKKQPFSTVFMVHSETTSGLINPIQEVGMIAKKYNTDYIVDAMSSFGGIPIDFESSCIDVLVTSANKCIQGIPGFGITIAKKSLLEQCCNRARSLSLDLYDQDKGLNGNGQFRFTPPTHTICAFQQALNELNEEGGVMKRNERYEANKKIICDVMLELGFELYLPVEDQGPIISSFKYPNSVNWDFEMFYNKLAEHDFLIYPGKVTNADCFRIGHIGNLYPDDMKKFGKVVEKACNEMQLFKLK